MSSTENLPDVLKKLLININDNEQLKWSNEARAINFEARCTKLRAENDYLLKTISRIKQDHNELVPNIDILGNIYQTYLKSLRNDQESITQLRMFEHQLNESIIKQEEQHLEFFKKFDKYYEEKKQRLQNNCPAYAILKEQRIQLTKLRIEVNQMRMKIDMKKRMVQQKQDISKKMIYNEIIKFAENYVAQRDCLRLEKELKEAQEKEQFLMKKYFDLKERIKAQANKGHNHLFKKSVTAEKTKNFNSDKNSKVPITNILTECNKKFDEFPNKKVGDIKKDQDKFNVNQTTSNAKSYFKDLNNVFQFAQEDFNFPANLPKYDQGAFNPIPFKENEIKTTDTPNKNKFVFGKKDGVQETNLTAKPVKRKVDLKNQQAKKFGYGTAKVFQKVINNTISQNLSRLYSTRSSQYGSQNQQLNTSLMLENLISQENPNTQDSCAESKTKKAKLSAEISETPESKVNTKPENAMPQPILKNKNILKEEKGVNRDILGPPPTAEDKPSILKVQPTKYKEKESTPLLTNEQAKSVAFAKPDYNDYFGMNITFDGDPLIGGNQLSPSPDISTFVTDESDWLNPPFCVENDNNPSTMFGFLDYNKSGFNFNFKL